MTEVNAYVEVVVVPIRFMIPAPLPSCVHSGDIVIDLAAVFAVAANIVIDSRAIRFQPTTAIFLPILVCASRTSNSEYKPTGQRACKNRPTPDFIASHDCLRGAGFGARAVPLMMLAIDITRQPGKLSGQGCNFIESFTDRSCRTKPKCRSLS
jgi:hypothetical protein